MHRCFVPPALLAVDTPLLDGDPFHHLQVLRLGAGDELLLLDGQGALPKRLLDAGFSFQFERIEEALADILN